MTCSRRAVLLTLTLGAACAASSAGAQGIECLDPGLEAMVRECLNYGTKRGLGQWRNSGKGRYEWEEL